MPCCQLVGRPRLSALCCIILRQGAEPQRCNVSKSFAGSAVTTIYQAARIFKIHRWAICRDSSVSRGLGEGHVQLVPADAASNTNVDAFEQELLVDHSNYGCISLWFITKESAHPFVFRPRSFKRTIPGVQLVYCRDVKDFVRFARPIGLFLALRGKFFVAVNSNGPIPGLRGKYFAGARPLYCKGPMPHIGDLAYTQTVMHSQPRRALWPRGRRRRA